MQPPLGFPAATAGCKLVGRPVGDGRFDTNKATIATPVYKLLRN